jgi:hypothetical protein
MISLRCGPKAVGMNKSCRHYQKQQFTETEVILYVPNLKDSFCEQIQMTRHALQSDVSEPFMEFFIGNSNFI